MSARVLTRAVVRPQKTPIARWGLRYQSTAEKASETASKAKDTASNLQSKASQGLSRVTSSAGPALAGAAKGIGGALSRIGGRTGRLIAAIESAIPPTVYYSKVGLELGKLVFQGRQMSLPSFQTFQSYLQPLVNAARNPSSLLKSAPSSPDSVLSRIRNINGAQLASGGVVFAEVLGFFTVGEMIGRMKLVGYRGEVHHEH